MRQCKFTNGTSGYYHTVRLVLTEEEARLVNRYTSEMQAHSAECGGKWTLQDTFQSLFETGMTDYSQGTLSTQEDI